MPLTVNMDHHVHCRKSMKLTLTAGRKDLSLSDHTCFTDHEISLDRIHSAPRSLSFSVCFAQSQGNPFTVDQIVDPPRAVSNTEPWRERPSTFLNGRRKDRRLCKAKRFLLWRRRVRARNHTPQTIKRGTNAVTTQ